MADNTHPDFVDVAGAAEILGIHPESVRRLARAGELDARRDGNRWRFPVDQLESGPPRRPGARPAPMRQDAEDEAAAEDGPSGMKALILGIIDVATRDALSDSRWAADARQYFASDWYAAHVGYLGLPDGALPAALRKRRQRQGGIVQQ